MSNHMHDLTKAERVEWLRMLESLTVALIGTLPPTERPRLVEVTHIQQQAADLADRAIYAARARTAPTKKLRATAPVKGEGNG